MPHRLELQAMATILVLVVVCGSCGERVRSADETVTWVAHGVADQQPDVLWEALPASYQEDVNELIQEFAGAVDADIYDKAFTIVRKTADVLDAKKDVILGSSVIDREGLDRDRVARNWDSAAGFLRTVADSDLGTLERLVKLEPRAFLSSTGSALMEQASRVSQMTEQDPYAAQFKNTLGAVSAELVASDADTATVRITVPDQQPEELQFVRVEGKWVPRQLADTWDESIAAARENIATLASEEMQEQKLQVLMGLGVAELMIDQIGAIETSEDFDAAMKGMLGQLIGQIGQGIPQSG